MEDGLVPQENLNRVISNVNHQRNLLSHAKISRYYARLLAPFILSPVENPRKEANDYEGRITEKKDFR